jgi:hypothetical protein
MGRLHASTALAVSLGLTLALTAAGAARAGAAPASTGCGCVPTTHQVKVPGIEVTPPSVTVDIPTINFGTSSANSSSSASSSAAANAGVTINTSASGGVNTQAILNESNGGFGGGGGGSWSDSGSVTTTIDSVKVYTPPPVETRRICAAFKAAVKMVAIQASCLDDKDIPHPASQLNPDRAVADTYEGELYRCIAGARMQYTMADYSGQANFDHGQTLTCQKGEALYHNAAGVLQCRAQKPARDCNERSLLRRFGAGIKILKVSQSQVCAAWRTETVQANAGE